MCVTQGLNRMRTNELKSLEESNLNSERLLKLLSLSFKMAKYICCLKQECGGLVGLRRGNLFIMWDQNARSSNSLLQAKAIREVTDLTNDFE